MFIIFTLLIKVKDDLLEIFDQTHTSIIWTFFTRLHIMEFICMKLESISKMLIIFYHFIASISPTFKFLKMRKFKDILKIIFIIFTLIIKIKRWFAGALDQTRTYIIWTIFTGLHIMKFLYMKIEYK